jgi:uncharacterized membrane protein YeaQ/YmgE (transglycosylase-associated protein family)
LPEITQQVIEYLKANAVLALAIAFIAGLAATKSVAHERHAGVFTYFVVGAVGFFLGQFAMVYFGLQDYLKEVSQFRILFDFVAAYVGSFVVAATIHFIKPT